MPKSLKQVGLPMAATQAAIADDNPLTPEKIELGRKLSSTADYQPTARLRAQRVMIRRAHSPTGSQSRSGSKAARANVMRPLF
jgi:hypothetical protein